MFDGQSIAADQLVKIIQTLQIGRTTGSLVATRGEGPSYEAGTLVFVQGHVVQAKVGRREDREALNWLSTWGRCRYTFVPSLPSGSGIWEESREVQQEPTRSIYETVQQEPARPISETVQQEPTRPHEAVPYPYPYRNTTLEHGLQVIDERGLSRGHRHLFLLVNGERELFDFMRLLNLNEFEVLEMLYSLQDVGIISIPKPLSF